MRDIVVAHDYSVHIADKEAALSLLLADSRSPNTKKAYQADLTDFFRWRGTEATPEAVTALCSLDAPNLSLLLHGYKAHLRERGLSESTVNRRLAAVRSLLRMARRLGAPIPDPAGLVKGEKVTPYRDTRGPEASAVARLLEAPDRSTVTGKRDYALLLLFCENALRRGEIQNCDVSDFDAEGRRLLIVGKGRGSQKEPITLSQETVEAIGEYLAARGFADSADAIKKADAPLFASGHRAKAGARLSARGLYHVIDGYGRRVLGKPLHPHALRHAAITAALDATGDVRKVQKLSRHADLRTLTLYDDARADHQGEVTQLLSALWKGRQRR